MTDPTFSDIDLKDKMAWVCTTRTMAKTTVLLLNLDLYDFQTFDS